MPAFVKNGPDIPEHLLQMHEEGQVVFFCGAGISYPAGLPGFKGLVDGIYSKLGTSLNPIEKQSYEKKQYDSTLDQLERRHPGHRLAVRAVLSDVLKPNLRKKHASKTHQVLLTLSTDRNGKVRLVTTNFDNIFSRVIKKQKLDIPEFAAPLLPIPKRSRWHGVVYLHGLLPNKIDETELNRLILTSGDFGLAYLTEQWAARFVSELFRSYVVCFVGYGINDPVLRYMMDALAADELLGEKRTEAYAFASYSTGDKEQVQKEWVAKGVEPLLYEVKMGTHDHSDLHRTLHEWGNTYHDGIQGKEMIIAQHASYPPLGPSKRDYAVGRVLWALTDELAAKHFAEINPVPPLKWLEALSENQFTHSDLQRFGVAPNNSNDKDLQFSFLCRPSPYTSSPRMCIVDWGKNESDWDSVMFQLARWLIRHLDDPELILWLANYGGQIKEQFKKRIQTRLSEIDNLIANGNQEKLDLIREDSPKAIPGIQMRRLWRLFLAGRVKSFSRGTDFYYWLRRIESEGVTPSLRLELRELLAPKIKLRAPFRWSDNREYLPESTNIKQLVDWEIILSSEHVNSAIKEYEEKPYFLSSLHILLEEFTILLSDAFDLMGELGGIEEKSDLSYISQPSISEHHQNNYYQDWTVLVKLSRDAWLATAKQDKKRAFHAAQGWWGKPYPIFKRLSFFALTQTEITNQQLALEWLLSEGGWWLWSIETQREVCRLLVTLATKLDGSKMALLEHHILTGPPRKMFKNDLDQKDWEQIIDREIWLRLAKLHYAGGEMSSTAISKLEKISKKYPKWILSDDEKEEFPFWMESGKRWSIDEETPEGFARAPIIKTRLMEWLQKYPGSHRFSSIDGWQTRCRENPEIALQALSELAHTNNWPVDRWREALQIWSEESFLMNSWPKIATVLNSAPDDIIKSIAYSLSAFIQKVGKIFKDDEDLFFKSCERILEIDYDDDGNSDDPITRAINHPIGYVTQALLDWWYRNNLEDDQGLPQCLKELFSKICDTQEDKFRHGRILLTAHAITLFRVDKEWTTNFLLPLFEWRTSPNEARCAWIGFLWSPRLYKPFVHAVREQILETPKHYHSLDDSGKQFADFITFLSLDPSDIFTIKELTDAVAQMPINGLENSSQALVRAIEGSRDKRKSYWQNRILPFIHNIWPKTIELITTKISENFAHLCISASEAFPDAIKIIGHWLKPIQDPDYIIHLLYEAKLCEKFPKDALYFLDTVIGDNVQWIPRKLEQCLEGIKTNNKKLGKDIRFIRISDLIRRKGTN